MDPAGVHKREVGADFTPAFNHQNILFEFDHGHKDGAYVASPEG